MDSDSVICMIVGVTFVMRLENENFTIFTCCGSHGYNLSTRKCCTQNWQVAIVYSEIFSPEITLYLLVGFALDRVNY